MLVQQILRLKGNDDVVTLKKSSSLKEASDLLTSRKIGTVVVSEDGKIPLGILSERDIVHAVSKDGEASLTRPISKYMTSKLITCNRGETADKILTIMTDKRIRRMPVIEDDKMIGIITIGDVVKSRLLELSREKEALQEMIAGH